MFLLNHKRRFCKVKSSFDSLSLVKLSIDRSSLLLIEAEFPSLKHPENVTNPKANNNKRFFP